jgi:hypothetical protein
MSPRTFACIFSAWCACLVTEGLSQAADTVVLEADTVSTPRIRPPRDTTEGRFIPTGVRFGADLIAIGKSRFNDEFTGWEIAADIDFYRYFLVVEYGKWATNYPLRNGDYSSDGTYFRIGVDVNFLFRDPEKNMFFLGGRFGRSSYSDEAAYVHHTTEFLDNNFYVQNPDVVATWVELTTGLKVKIWKFFWLGATARFKFGLDLDGNGLLRSYDVPGFGRNIGSTYWGFNYYVLVRIPFKAEPK